MSAAAPALVGLVAAQRLAELMVAGRNTRRLLARGAVEHGQRHYPLFVALHAGWLAANLAAAARRRPLAKAPLAGLALLEVARLWVMRSLGPQWTTRVISLPDAPLVNRGPYRLFRHPNYLVVAGEIALLPLALRAPRLAAGFLLANGLLTAWRLRVEERALAERPLSGR